MAERCWPFQKPKCAEIRTCLSLISGYEWLPSGLRPKTRLIIVAQKNKKKHLEAMRSGSTVFQTRFQDWPDRCRSVPKNPPFTDTYVHLQHWEVKSAISGAVVTNVRSFFSVICRKRKSCGHRCPSQEGSINIRKYTDVWSEQPRDSAGLKVGFLFSQFCLALHQIFFQRKSFLMTLCSDGTVFLQH